MAYQLSDIIIRVQQRLRDTSYPTAGTATFAAIPAEPAYFIVELV